MQVSDHRILWCQSLSSLQRVSAVISCVDIKLSVCISFRWVITGYFDVSHWVSSQEVSAVISCVDIKLSVCVSSRWLITRYFDVSHWYFSQEVSYWNYLFMYMLKIWSFLDCQFAYPFYFHVRTYKWVTQSLFYKI